jgi:hypothetical protein
LLGAIFKAIANPLRNNLQFIDSVAQHQRAKGCGPKAQALHDYRKKLFRELSIVCYEMIGLLSRQLIPRANMFDDQIYYLMLTADCYRYISENCDESDKWEPTNSANETYEQTVQVARDHLAPYNPVLLNAILNFTVFTYQILGRRDDAIRDART